MTGPRSGPAVGVGVAAGIAVSLLLVWAGVSFGPLAWVVALVAAVGAFGLFGDDALRAGPGAGCSPAPPSSPSRRPSDREEYA